MVVKVVFVNENNVRCNFSRSPCLGTETALPKTQTKLDFSSDFRRFAHIGFVRPYRAVYWQVRGLTLSTFRALGKLEQLRFLHQGIKVQVPNRGWLATHGC